MARAEPFTSEIWEDSGPVLMARIFNHAGTLVTQASVSAIAYKVFDLSAPATATATGTLTVSSVIFDTLQAGVIWTSDSVGYNFRWATPASLFPTGGRTYRVEIVLDMASGEDIPIPFELPTRELLGS